MVWVMVRSAKEWSWDLKNSVAVLAERIAIVLMDPIWSHTMGPYFSLRLVMVR